MESPVLKNDKPKVINILAKTVNGTINFQAAYDVKYLYRQIKKYFEQELLSNSKQLSNTEHLQNVLMKRAKDIQLLNEFDFDNDLRAIELAILVGVLQTTYTLGKHSTDYTLIPSWQLPDQTIGVKAHFRKGSWDGFLLGLPKNTAKETISIPLELKSLMINPKISVKGNPNYQLTEGLKIYKKYFQKPASINCVLVMPYSSETNLSIDLKKATDDLRSSISSESMGFICLLTFPYDKESKPVMSILFAMVSQDPSFMSAHNQKEWMQQINFGKSQ
ncbi:MAG: hypothetical protein AAB553_01370 [Patescibacteria group bacterium]